MSTLDDLQHVLSAHADEAVGAAVSPTERAAAVRGRVRAVRRRRQAATALAAVAVVAGGAALWLPGREGPSPLDRPTIGGKVVPKTMSSLGYGYDFRRAATGDGSATLRLGASTTPRLVTWVARGDVELQTTFDDESLGRQPVERLTSGTFADFQIVTEDAQRLRLTGTGTVGLAVYDLATRAPGVTQHGVTWRYDVGGYQLLQAGTGVAGQTRVSGTVTLPLRNADPDPRLSVRYVCSAGPSGSIVHLTLAGREVVSGGCQGGDGERLWDAATVSGGFDDIDPDDYGRPGQTIPYEATLTTGSAPDGPAPVDDDVQIGVGLYLDLPAGGRVGTNDVATLVEENGHTYRLQRVTASEPGARSLRVTVTARRTPILVRVVTSDALPGYTRILGDGKEIVRLGDAAGGSSQATAAALLLETSADFEVRVRKAGPRTVLGLATYVRSD